MAESSGGDKPFVYTVEGWVLTPSTKLGHRSFVRKLSLALSGACFLAHVTPNCLETAEMGGLRTQVDCQWGRGGSVHLELRQAGLCQKPHPS